MKIEQLRSIRPYQSGLVELLQDCVQSGASIGFIAPLEEGEAGRYWQDVDVELVDGSRTMLVAVEDGQIAGAVQLSYCMKKNGNHRASVEKLIVHTNFRQRGIGRQLMVEIEREARAEQRTLLVLDTRNGDPASTLYRTSGYLEAGQIPAYARNSDGELAGTTLFYKLL